jgi:predicted N-formylglutamate amidohydrolase
VRNAGAESPFLLLGDHAGRLIPQALGDLGVSEADLGRHIAWDIGVAGLGERLAMRLGCCFIAQRFSRLAIDCNRDPARPDAICERSDGSHVPGNRGLSAAARAARVAEIFAPYHARIAEELDARAVRGVPTILLALHSFTPEMAGQARPWRFGVLHADDAPFARAVLAELRLRLDPAEVGDNEPYAMDEVDFTVPHHARPRGLDYLELEVRQDLIAEPGGQDAVASILTSVLPAALARL